MKPPKDLSAAGNGVWRDVHAAVDPAWELDERDRLVLAQAARQADLIAKLEAVIERDGVVVAGAAGQLRLSSAVPALTAARALLARLLAQVEIGPPAAKTGTMNSRQRAQLRRAASG